MKKIFEKVKAATGTAGGLAGDGVSALVNGARATATATMDAAGDALNVVTDTSRAASHVASTAGRALVASADASFVTARDTVLDAKDLVPGAIHNGSSFISSVAGLSSLVGLFVAPVPTVIGLIILEVVTSMVSESTADDAAKGSDRIERRRFEREVGLLRRHGIIPQTSVLASKDVEIRINLLRGEIVGTVLTGPHAGWEFHDLSDDELEGIVANTRRQDTVDIIKGYRVYAAAKLKAESIVTPALS